MSQHNQITVTDEGLKSLQEELEYLRNVKRKEVIEAIGEARALGDLSENSEYDEARNEQAKLFGRITEIEDILAHAVIIEDENEASGHIGLGCTVQIQDLSSGELLEFRITGSQEANPMMGKMSDDSPFGRALVGHGPGEVVTVEAPAGRFEAKILSVTR